MDYQELLRQHDHPTHTEWPPGFDRKRAIRRARQFGEVLSAAIGVSLDLETDLSTQDASFHSQLYLPSVSGGYTLLRFSSFGDMVTVAEDDPVSDELCQLLQNLLPQYAYIYVPAAVLETPYNGQHPSVHRFRTWWDRFFDW